ncbi:Zn(II)2Cys6 transcription factor [Aspergillus affinis]|uniref:Zn(II)2Cys6 transcription factor n=1 Tax=Aspergillus affinis TaxID=1070780 RepID=UPI0022FDE682|nr:uncharacterized protein KD926_004149 [Aspergillus affinis]KAI9046311.1 hypothetical protein KD926_004149 [Aspergillus affinis]
MVGVPHSTGCPLCRERRIKCDKATPSCTQCRKYGRPCPGYTRTFRFQDEGPGLERRHASSASTTSEQNRPTSNAASDAAAAAAAVVRDNALAMMHREQVHAQQTQPQAPSNIEDFSFGFNSGFDASLSHSMQATHPVADINTLIRTIFHTHYHHNLFRLSPETITSTHPEESRYQFQAASTACLISIYSAHASNDPSRLKTSRYLYAQALREVVAGLYSEAALSADMLSAIMNLALFEMFARTSPGAWAVHVDGVRRLMRSRGAEGHMGGLAKGNFLLFRGFLVLAAFEQEGRCFLEEEEWRALGWGVAREDLARGAGGMARWVDVEERVFGEVVRLPGLVGEARQVGRGGEGERLGREIRRVRQRLVQLGTELQAGMEAQTPRVRVAGVTMPDRAPWLLLQGVESAVALLDGLLARRRSDGRFRPFRVACALNEGPAAMPHIEGITWLDQVASSFGMIGVMVVDGQ